MIWHLIEGEAGCRFAREHGCSAVIVDALRASATAAMMLRAGARELLIVRDVDDARALRRQFPDALLYGERGGLPPSGFDGGNSPMSVDSVAGRSVIFTTTTGANRLVEAWGARAVFMGSTVNAPALTEALVRVGSDVVLIPAGLTGDPTFFAQEDWAAAVAIAASIHPTIGEGAEAFSYWEKRLHQEGLEHLFLTSPHADKLRRVGLSEDIPFCAKWGITSAVPVAVEKVDAAIRCVDFRNR
ncbi:MAG TPA: 2-phosphosulfolactate phosphatase [Candidatus Hydrogenedentes bacterium]|nr:2-phosphosulfolactate phosphatase [Candidatus Hydrogenedentota bacterium]HOL78269.1 2-phosphosulfolactate phosphatase [Candidatus Hydrogenedentota bacterium]HPO85370.1 2-phosphosulfolactate phosphatase [Candidatus Hydrogenedentota bacterium]